MRPKIVVIKYGGAAMQTPALIQTTLQDVVRLKRLGIQPVLVHGGGPEISKMCQQMGIVPAFVNGLRVTDRETLEIAQMVLVGKINKELVSLLNQEEGRAVGLSGQDANLILAKQADKNLGFVGEIEQVNPEILILLIEAGFIPVIAPMATSKRSQSYNINADSAASEIGAALQADSLILLTDVEGVLKDPKDPSTKIDIIKTSEWGAVVESGSLKGGMIPKIEGALAAIQRGVNQVHILDGRVPNVLLLHFQDRETKGTSIYV
ncbi:MAG: acetylglutamate kinase [Chlamydiales bacterium]